MKQLLEISQFEQTTVDVAKLKTYLFGVPQYLEVGIHMGVSQLTRCLLDYTDAVEYWLRRYLAGFHKTLHRLFGEIRTFLRSYGEAARVMIKFSLDAVLNTLLENEWFELMPRYQRARTKIYTTFSI